MADLRNKRLARIEENLMCWMQIMADAISRCKPLHMMYISASQHQPNTVYDEVKEFLEVDLVTLHAAISLVSSDTVATMMSWNQVHRAMEEDGTLLRLMDQIQKCMPDSGLELDQYLREFHRPR